MNIRPIGNGRCFGKSIGDQCNITHHLHRGNFRKDQRCAQASLIPLECTPCRTVKLQNIRIVSSWHSNESLRVTITSSTMTLSKKCHGGSTPTSIKLLPMHGRLTLLVTQQQVDQAISCHGLRPKTSSAWKVKAVLLYRRNIMEDQWPSAWSET